MADRRTTAQLNRIAKALQLAGYKEAAEIVALAALSVHIAATVKSRRKRRLRKSYEQAIAASDPAQPGTLVVPFPPRRRSARSS
jgi:hypothetical protein